MPLALSGDKVEIRRVSLHARRRARDERGRPAFRRAIVLEFPGMKAGRRWYDSSDYQSIIPYRSGASNTQMVLVEGVA
jgi:uncharacterized protein (DUF1330 family)